MLQADDEGKIKGRYVSADTQSEYPLKGRISGEPHRLLLDVEMPNAVQTFEAYLWTSDKSTLAGTTVMVDRTFGFYATRETDKPADAKPAAPKEEKSSAAPDAGK